jgi:8-hydroxy-5-deazaflavin:NADPH oxidoreductase
VTNTIGFVGVGPINMSLARFALGAGYDVIVSNSRGPETLGDSVAELGGNTRAATVEDAARSSGIVVISIPLDRYVELPVEPFVGKPVVDTNNYYPQRVGRMEELEQRTLTSSEMIQRHLKGSHVVKAFHNLDMHHLANGPRPADDPERWALPIVGDDDDAKAKVAAFMDAVGFDPVDCGRLADSWRIQAATPVYVLPYVGEPPEGMSKDERRAWFRQDRSKVIKAEDVRALAAQADPQGRVGALFEDLPSGLMD